MIISERGISLKFFGQSGCGRENAAGHKRHNIKAASAVLFAALSLGIAALGAGSVSGANDSFRCIVAAEKLNIYANENLSGEAVASYRAGDRLTVSKHKDGVLCVIGEAGIKGYCSPVDLVGIDSVVYRYVPYKLGKDASGGILVSDLVDLDYYIYDRDSKITNGSGETLLIQRATVKKLEEAAAAIGGKYSVRIMSAYRPSSSDPGLGVPSNTGALLKISVRQGDVEWQLSDLPSFISAMEKAGFSLVDGQSAYFCDNEYTSYLGVDYDTGNLPVFVLRQ